jgi:hypothetical protein
MGTMAVLDQTGDTQTTWNRDNPDEVEQARRTFNDLKKKRFLIYKVDKHGQKGEIMREFDPDAQMLIAAPALVGG